MSQIYETTITETGWAGTAGFFIRSDLATFRDYSDFIESFDTMEPNISSIVTSISFDGKINRCRQSSLSIPGCNKNGTTLENSIVYNVLIKQNSIKIDGDMKTCWY